MSEAETANRYWDVNIQTHNPLRKAFVVVEAPDEEKAEEVARNAAALRWPDETIKELVVTPTKTSRAQRRKMGLK